MPPAPSLDPQALQSLQEALFRHSHDAQYVLDVEQDRFLLVNDAFLALVGRSWEELKDRPSLEFADPDAIERERARRSSSNLLSAETYPFRMRRGDGALVDVELSVRRITIGGRRLVFGSARDRTEALRRERERETVAQAMRENDQRLRLLAQQIPAILWTTDRDLRVTSAMGRGMEAIGASEEAVLGLRMQELLGTEDLEYLPLRMHRKAQAGEAVEYEMLWRGRNYHTFIGPVRGPSGEVQGCLGLALDLTERIRDAEALRESEERFRKLSEATTEGIVFEEGGRILFANEVLARLTGFPLSELVGADGLSMIAPESRDQVAAKMREGGDVSYEAVGLRKDGSTFQYEARSRTIPFQGRSVRVVAIRDITPYKQLQASLERQVRLEKKKTLEAFQANVRIFQLTEKVRAAYESTSLLVNARTVEELASTAVKLLCDPAGLDYREALVYVARDGGLELLAAHPEQAPVVLAADADHPACRALRAGTLQADAAGLALPLKGQTGAVGALEVRFHQTEEVRSWQENILKTLANSLSLMLENLNLYEIVRKQSITDGLTGAYNRRHFDDKLVAEVERAVRYKRDLTLVMIDLDDFKRINDDPNGGHLQGDEVLRDLAATLRKHSRQIDILCRYGGDEFSLILPETSLTNGSRHAERLRETIAAKEFRYRTAPDRTFRFTVSIGVSGVGARHQTPEAVLQAADQAAFRAKRGGKNRVCVAEDAP